MVLEARNPTQREVISYSGVSGNQLTGVVRGIGGTTAKSHLKNALIEMNVLAEDFADLYAAFNSFAATNINGWATAANLPTTIVYQGLRNYLWTFNGVDLTGIYSEGMRLRGTRSTNAPTQAGNFNGTNQYLTKAAPNKSTFTDNVTLGATIKMSRKLLNASNMYFMGRGDAAANNFWGMYVTPNGNIGMSASVGAGNNRFVQTINAIEYDRETKVRGKWVNGTVTIYVNGIPMQTTQSTAGTPPTNNLAQTGNYSVGCLGTATAGTFFPGEISQAFVFGAALTDTQVRALDSQGIVGNETNLLFAHSLNNVLTDLMTTTPNDLTNTNSVTFATGGGFGNNGRSASLDYGMVVSKPVYSGGNTSFYVQVPEGSTMPTTATPLSALSYGVGKNPFGFPSESGKWDMTAILRGGRVVAIGSVNNLHASLFGVSLPVGCWSVHFGGVCILNSSVGGARNGGILFADGVEIPTVAGNNTNAPSKRIYSPSGTDALEDITLDWTFRDLTSIIFVQLYGYILSATGSEQWIVDSQSGEARFTAKNNWL